MLVDLIQPQWGVNHMTEPDMDQQSTQEAAAETAGSASIPHAELVVDEIRVQGFRSLVEVAVPLEPGVTYLVGENNSGKSSLLLALHTACGSRRPVADDLHRAGDGAVYSSAVIDLLIRSKGDEFTEEVGQRLAANAGPGPKPGEWTGIRTTLTASREGHFLGNRRTFLQWDPATSDWIDTRTRVGEKVLELVTAQLLDASRDLTAEAGNRTSDWGRVLTDLSVSDEDRRRLEADLVTLAEQLHESSPVFRTLREQLAKVAQAMSGVDEVSLQALPAQLEELGKAVEVFVGRGGRTGLPLRFQGLGSRSLAALTVFHALCELRVGADQGVRPHILTLLEEPEAHLHPQAQAAVSRVIQDLPGQAIVATHSPVLIAEVDPRCIRIIRATPSATVVHSLDFEIEKKIAVFRRYVERPLGELFFANLVIFVDGTAERISLPVMLEPLLGKEPAGCGVSVIDCEGMTKEQLEKATAALRELGDIPWLVFVDNDEHGLNALEGVEGSDGVTLSPEHSDVTVSGRKQLEQLLLDAGYHAEVKHVANTYLPWGPDDPRFGKPRLPEIDEEGAEGLYLSFLADNKGWAAEHVVRRAAGAGRAMPAPIAALACQIRDRLSLPEPRGERYATALGGADREDAE